MDFFLAQPLCLFNVFMCLMAKITIELITSLYVRWLNNFDYILNVC